MKDPSDQPEWTDTISGDIKINGHLHIMGTESHAEVITSDHYVRLA